MAVKKKLTKKIVAKKIEKKGSKNVAKKPQINVKNLKVAKNIKKTYMLDDLEESDSDLDNLSEVSENELEE